MKKSKSWMLAAILCCGSGMQAWAQSPIDVLPYVNAFETDEEQSAFSIIDANQDESTWEYVIDSEENHFLRYEYNSENSADDWLISPAIKLEAGQRYRVAMDVRNRYGDERIEMMMGSEATAEAMTLQVIEPTDVVVDVWKTLENRVVTVSETGYYHFGIHAISDADCDRLFVDNFSIEQMELGAPDVVTNLNAVATENKLEATITFNAPTNNLGGEPLSANLTKVELLRDGNVIHTFEDVAPGAELSYVDNAADLTIGTHRYQAVAYNEKGTGEMGEAVAVYLSALLEVPYSFDLIPENGIEAFTIIDANGDGNSWMWEEGYRTFNEYSSENAADDYLITPPIHMLPGTNYNLVVNTYTTGYPESFEVKMGKQPTVEGLSTTLIEPTVVTNDDETGEDYEKVFTVDEEGIYYIAIHAISEADMYRQVFNRLAIEFGPVPASPAMPAIEPVADAEGELKATIHVTAPTTAFDGSALTANITRIDIKRDGEVVGAVENIAPGETKDFVDELEAIGTYTYQAIPQNESGVGQKSEKVSVYVGVDVPLVVTNVLATDNETSVHLTWDKVGSEGVNGAFVNTAKVDYNVWHAHLEEMWYGGVELILDEQLATLRDADSYDLDYNLDEGDQKFDFWVIEASNDAGTAEPITTGLVVGKPYDLPVQESFAESALHYFWDTDAALLVSSDAADDDNVALAVLSDHEGACYFNSGKLNLANAAEPVLRFEVKAKGITQLTVTGSVNGDLELQPIQADIPVTMEYTTVEVPLSALKDGRYAMVGIQANFTTATVFDWMGEIEQEGDIMLIDNIRIEDNNDTGIALTTSADASFDVYATDGTLIRRQATSLDGLKGIFVVRSNDGSSNTIARKIVK